MNTHLRIAQTDVQLLRQGLAALKGSGVIRSNKDKERVGKLILTLLCAELNFEIVKKTTDRLNKEQEAINERYQAGS